MLSEPEITAAVGTRAYGADGDELGTVEYFFVDDRTGAPTWVAVTTGVSGTRHSIVPATDATFGDGALRLPVSKDAVRTAPHMAGDHLDPAEEDALRRHYATAGRTGLDASEADRPVEGRPVDDTAVREAPVPAGAPDRVDEGAMTRSEERLRVDTAKVATTRARIVKYVVTENVTITVPIRREEIRVEQVPLDATDEDDLQGESLLPRGEAAGSPVAGSGLPGEIVLHTERPVVTVEVVPVERVRLRTEVVEGAETITEQVQREQIAVDRTPRFTGTDDGPDRTAPGPDPR
jgi:stress response protein YsnF